MPDTERSLTISANTLHHDENILTNNDGHHLLMTPSNDSILPVNNNQQKLPSTPLRANQHSLVQTADDICQHMRKNAIKT